ncbi:hypothetical protein AAG614_03980 [Citromicrobium bathyomarinum]
MTEEEALRLLDVEHLSTVYEIEDGELRGLLPFLQAGQPVPASIASALISMIESGAFDPAKRRIKEAKMREFLAERREISRWDVGVWLAVRDDATPRGSQARLFAAAARRFGISERKARRALTEFRKGIGDFESDGYFYLQEAREMCAEHRLDFEEFSVARGSGQKFDLDFGQ